jgi:hypothetical protein
VIAVMVPSCGWGVAGFWLIAAALVGAIYWTGKRVAVPGERYLVALVIAIVLAGGAVRLSADLILPACTQDWLEQQCGSWWCYCGIAKGCWLWCGD